MFYTYILKLNDGSFYTGLTGNLPRRLLEHNAGKSISTRRYLPAQMIFNIESDTRQEARKIEVDIKKRGARRFLLKHFMHIYDVRSISKYNLI